MKHLLILATFAAISASPALAGGGHGGTPAGGILAPIGGIISPVNGAGLQVNALNNVGLNNVGVGNGNVVAGNKVGIVTPVKAIVSRNGLVGGLLGGAGGHGCGCN